MSPVLAAILVTLKLAGLTTLILLLLGMPLAWWLARTRSRWRIPIGALVALPMVLPPTVLGFYLLLGMGPNGPIGQLTTALGLGTLAFTFQGLLFASRGRDHLGAAVVTVLPELGDHHPRPAPF